MWLTLCSTGSTSSWMFVSRRNASTAHSLAIFPTQCLSQMEWTPLPGNVQRLQNWTLEQGSFRRMVQGRDWFFRQLHVRSPTLTGNWEPRFVQLTIGYWICDHLTLDFPYIYTASRSQRSSRSVVSLVFLVMNIWTMPWKIARSGKPREKVLCNLWLKSTRRVTKPLSAWFCKKGTNAKLVHVHVWNGDDMVPP